METLEEAELCFPQFLNSSCKKLTRPRSEALTIYILMSCISLLTVVLNLLVIVSISHFRHRIMSHLRQYLYTNFSEIILLRVLNCCVLTFASKCMQPEFVTFSYLSLLLMMVLVLIMFTVMLFSLCRQLHTPTNLLLLSLAVSDFLIGLVVMPFQILATEPCWLLSDSLCVFYNLFTFITIFASVVNMVLISVDRYVAVCDPLHYATKVTQRRVQLCVLFSWVSCVFYAYMMLYDILKQPGRFNSCYGECVITVNGALDLVLGFILPISAIIILYVRVFVVAVSQARSMRSHVAAVKLQRSLTVTVRKSEIKAAKTLGVTVVVFLMCYCPPYCVSLSGYNITIGTSSSNFLGLLVSSNSCLNPVIYAFLYPWFRKSVKFIVTLQILQPKSSEVCVN